MTRDEEPEIIKTIYPSDPEGNRMSLAEIWVEEGKAEERNALIKSMHHNGISVEQIAKCASLSEDEVRAILVK